FTLDIAFLTGGGISPRGISTATPESASFTRAVADVSRRRIALAPHEKIGIDMFARSMPIHELDLVITDADAPSAIVEAIERAGTAVVVATSGSDRREEGHAIAHASARV